MLYFTQLCVTINLRLEKLGYAVCGGMADASDSKSDVGDYVRVQVPSSAVDFMKEHRRLKVFGAFFALAHLLDIHYNKIDVFRGTKEERMK